MMLFFCRKYLDKTKGYVGSVIVAIFLLASIVAYSKGVSDGYTSFVLGLLACVGFVLLFSAIQNENAIASFLAKYTMPIFLMHTIFAAPIRTVLMKLGVHSAVIHVVIGLAISFVGPIIAAEIMKRFKWMEIFIYPGKYIKLK